MESLNPNAAKADAMGLLKQGQLDAAIGILEGVRAISPEDPQLQSMLGAAYARKGDHSSAIGAFEQVVRLQETPKTCFNLALAYERAGRIGDAFRQYEAAAKLDPSYQPAHDSIERIRKRFQDEQARAQTAQIAAEATPATFAPERAPETLAHEAPPAPAVQQPVTPVQTPKTDEVEPLREARPGRPLDRHRQITLKGVLYGAICGGAFITILTLLVRLFFGGFIGPMPTKPAEFLAYLAGLVLLGVIYGAAVGWWVGYSESDGAGWKAGAVIGAVMGLVLGTMAGGVAAALILLGIYCILSGLTGFFIGRLVETSIGWR